MRGIAPGLTSLTFSQTWLSAELWFLGASQVLDAPRLPDSFSISYGQCESTIRGKGSTPTTRAGANLMDAMLVRLGIAGVGSYASAGDFGSTCNGAPLQWCRMAGILAVRDCRRRHPSDAEPRQPTHQRGRLE